MKTAQTPVGVTDLTPVETAEYTATIEKVVKVLEKNKFKLVRTPTIEYYDALSNGMGPILQKKAVKFVDATGELVTLRPDHTLAIARLVSTRLSQEKLPLKLYYNAPVFRNPEPHSNQDTERYQVGLEYIGDSSPKTDAETIKICIDCLKAAGIKDFGVDIGHVDFVKGLSKSNKDALISGDYVALGEIPKRGGSELVTENKDLKKCLGILKKEGYEKHITINKGLVKDLHYYTGIIFDVYVGKTKKSVASGGRYDNLLSKYGKKNPAIGFAINMNKLIQELAEQTKK
jgi:ATP phosphoribosyltransferase regulatory subunit